MLCDANATPRAHANIKGIYTGLWNYPESAISNEAHTLQRFAKRIPSERIALLR